MAKKLFLLILILIFTLSLYADDGSVSYFPGGGGLYLIENPYIEMVEELLVIDMGLVTTEFYFKNSSNNTYTATLGFPIDFSIEYFFKIDRWTDDFHPPVGKKQEVFFAAQSSPFICFVDGKEVERKLEKDYEGRYYYTATITFMPKEIKRIVNTYSYSHRSYSTSLGDSGSESYYSLITGSSWKGPIGKIVIKLGYNIYDNNATNNIKSERIKEEYFFMSDSYKGTRSYIYPTPTRYEDGYAIWEYNNLKPDFNILWGYEMSGFFPASWMEAPLQLKHLFSALVFFNIANKKQTEVINEYINQWIVNYFIDIQTFINKKNWVSYYETNDKYKKAMVELYNVIIKYSSISNTNVNIKPELLQILCRLYINSQYALKGFIFSTPEWNNMFTSFTWYSPKSKQVIFDTETATYVQQIQDIENLIKQEIQ